MSSSQQSNDHESPPAELNADEIRTQLAVLREENERLREEYARAQQTSYRKTALALAVVGLGAVATGMLLSGIRDVLFVIGAIGVFGGILTWYLTPERVLTVSVSDSLYTALAANGERLRDELGLQTTPVYVPSADGVRLFFPQQSEFTLPDTLTTVFLTDDANRGVSLTPSGQALLADLERTQPTTSTDSLQATATQLGDALVEQFEIADAVSVGDSDDNDQLVVTIDGAAFGPVTSFDHPAVSVIACGLATAHEAPLAVQPVDETTVAFELDVPPLP